MSAYLKNIFTLLFLVICGQLYVFSQSKTQENTISTTAGY